MLCGDVECANVPYYSLKWRLIMGLLGKALMTGAQQMGREALGHHIASKRLREEVVGEELYFHARVSKKSALGTLQTATLVITNVWIRVDSGGIFRGLVVIDASDILSCQVKRWGRSRTVVINTRTNGRGAFVMRKSLAEKAVLAVEMYMG
jgi:hypothetical protein